MTLRLILALLLVQATSAATLEISSDESHALPADLFGQFLERPSWGGELGPEAVVGADGNLPEVVETQLAGYHTSLVRFPFGTDGDYLDWRDLADVPGRDERPCSTGHQGDVVTNRFGYPEYFDLAGRMGWQTILVTNLRDALYGKESIDQAAEHAADLVRYVRGLPGKSPIRAVQVGNEGWFFWPPKREDAAGLGIRNEGDAVARLRDSLIAFAESIHDVDPTLPLIADAPRPDDVGGLENGASAAWRAAVDHDDIRRRYQMLAAHAYAPLGIYGADRDGEELELAELSDDEIWFGLNASPGRFNEAGMANADDAAYAEIRRLGFRTAVTEWNWNGWDFEEKFPDSNVDAVLASALGAAGFLQGMMRSPDVALAT